MVNDFHRASLQCADFRGKNLASANFSHADIRGADFRDAVLIGANFRNTKAGLPIFWAIGLVVLSLILSLFAGLISAYAGAFIADLLSNNIYGNLFFGIISLITLAIFLIIIFWQGLGAILTILAEVVAACLIAALAFLPENEAGRNLVIGAVFTTLALTGVLAGIGNMAVAVAVARVMTLPKARTLAGVMAFIGAVLGVLLGVRSQESAYLIAGLIGLAAITSGIYIGCQAIAGEKKYSLIRAFRLSLLL